MPTGREKHGNLQIAVKLAGVLKLSVRCRFLGFANVEDPHSAVSTAMSTTYNSFGHAKKHLSCFAVLCNLTGRNAPNIGLTLIFGAFLLEIQNVLTMDHIDISLY